MDRETATFTHMGAEGVDLGRPGALHQDEKHVFQNLGDGTYYHSGLLAIRAAVAAKVNITYKILFNDAVAMTGGQPFDGPLTVPMIAQPDRGRRRAPDHRRHRRAGEVPGGFAAAPGVTVHHRDELMQSSANCARCRGYGDDLRPDLRVGEAPPPEARPDGPTRRKRVFINEAVCEGCGDCSKCQSTACRSSRWKPRRAASAQIDQSSCNKDYSCVNGFCPILRHRRRRPAEKAEAGRRRHRRRPLPTPTLPGLKDPFGILVTGIGGTGVVTIGELLGMAAHVEGKGCSIWT